jgi:hypothetical protein
MWASKWENPLAQQSLLRVLALYHTDTQLFDTQSCFDTCIQFVIHSMLNIDLLLKNFLWLAGDSAIISCYKSQLDIITLLLLVILLPQKKM